MKKLNHSGVGVEIPDEKKQEAILTFKDGTELRTGRKKMETQDVFVSYLENWIENHRQTTSNAVACKSHALSARVMRDEAIQAVDDLKFENYKDDDNPTAAFLAIAQNRMSALSNYDAQCESMEHRHNAAQSAVDDLETQLTKTETA